MIVISNKKRAKSFWGWVIVEKLEHSASKKFPWFSCKKQCIPLVQFRACSVNNGVTDSNGKKYVKQLKDAPIRIKS